MRWLAEKVLRLLSSGRLVEVMVAECREVSGARLTAQQEYLVGVLCRLPDVLSNCLRQHLDPGLLPQPYFSQLGANVFTCLQQVHSILRGTAQNAHDVYLFMLHVLCMFCLCSICRLQPPVPSCSGRQGCPAGTERYNHFLSNSSQLVSGYSFP